MPRIPIQAIPPTILNVLVNELELSPASIAAMSSQEVFCRWCDYEGLINWGPKLWEVVCTLKGVEK